MRERRIYWRKKGKAIVLEGRLTNGKAILIWTLPDANKFYDKILSNASFLPQEKLEQIKQKVMRLNYKTETVKNSSPKVPSIQIRRTQEKDAENEKSKGI